MWTYPTSVWRPRWGMWLECRRDFWRQKTRVPVLSYGAVMNVILGLAVFVELRLVTDWQTHDDSIARSVKIEILLSDRGVLNTSARRTDATEWTNTRSYSDSWHIISTSQQRPLSIYCQYRRLTRSSVDPQTLTYLIGMLSDVTWPCSAL